MCLIKKYNLPLYQLFQIIQPTIYPKTRFGFGRLEYTLRKFIIVIIIIIIIIILNHGIAYYTSFIFIHAALWEKKKSTIHRLFLCNFTHEQSLTS